MLNSDKRDFRTTERGLAEQQAALRRVATLVADGATAAELFTAVVGEVVAVLDVPAGWLFRYEPDSSASVLASLNDPGFPVGSRWQLDGPSLSAICVGTTESEPLPADTEARLRDFTELLATATEELEQMLSDRYPFVVVDPLLPLGDRILGFDDIEPATLVTPTLTRVRQPLGEIGRTAVNVLVHLLERRASETPHIELATRLVVRESTAPPRRSAS
jgi:hypothetical protein